MKVSILFSQEALINGISKNYEGDGLIGFLPAEKINGGYAIRDAYKDNSYTQICKGTPPFDKIKKFVDENKDSGKLFPWLMKQDGKGVDKWMEQMRVLIGNGDSFLTIPEYSSSFIYVPNSGLINVDYIGEMPGIAGFSNEILKLKTGIGINSSDTLTIYQ